MNLGEKLKQLRGLAGLTLHQVEEAAQVSNAYLSQLENGKIKKPSANVLYKLASLYGATLDDLLLAAGIISPTSHDELRKVTISMSEQEEKDLLDYLQFLRRKK